MLPKKGKICILVSKMVSIRLKVWGRGWEIWCEVSAMQQERNVAARVDFLVRKANILLCNNCVEKKNIYEDKKCSEML